MARIGPKWQSVQGLHLLRVQKQGSWGFESQYDISVAVLPRVSNTLMNTLVFLSQAQSGAALRLSAAKAVNLQSK